MSGLHQSSIGGAGRCRPSQLTTSRSRACAGAGSMRAIAATLSAERLAAWRNAVNAADPRPALGSDKRSSEDQRKTLLAYAQLAA